MKLQGAHAIAKYLGKEYYTDDVRYMLRVFGVKKTITDKGIAAFYITTEQADKLKKMIMEMRGTFK